MRVRDWQDIVRDVVESDAEPDDWRAVAGNRRSGIGEDLFLAHPAVGVFQLKTYAKNPYQLRGVGSKVARRIDDEIGPALPPKDSPARFAVQSPPSNEDEAQRTANRVEEVIKAHSDAPTTPDALFEDMMEAMDSPAFGPMAYEFDDRPEELDRLAGTFDEAEEVLNTELDDLVSTDEVDKSFM